QLYTGQIDSATQTSSGIYQTVNAGSTVDAGTSSGGILPPPITAWVPSAGPGAGGTSVEIDGTNFNGLTSVTIGGATAAVSFASENKIIVTSPGGFGWWFVVVTTQYGATANTNASVFQFNPPSAYADTVLASNPLAYWR